MAMRLSSLFTRSVFVPISKQFCFAPGGRGHITSKVSNVPVFPTAEGLNIRLEKSIKTAFGVNWPLMQDVFPNAENITKY